MPDRNPTTTKLSYGYLEEFGYENKTKDMQMNGTNIRKEEHSQIEALNKPVKKTMLTFKR